MTKEKKTVDIQLKIINIHTAKFCFEDSSKDDIDNLFNDQDALELKLKTSLAIDNEASTITININTLLIDKLKKKSLVEHTGRTTYQLKDIELFYDEKIEGYNIPTKLLTDLYQHAYDHSRALLATELSPTPYSDKYFLPVIDAKKFVRNK